jgi:hypothetical protein
LNIDETKENILEYSIYSSILVGICYIIFKIGVKLALILSVSGFLLGYTFSILVPTIINLKCVHYDVSGGLLD